MIGSRALQRLAQHEAGLRQRALAGVDEQQHAVDHGQAALDLAAEVGVAGGVDDVDGDRVAVGRLVVHGGVLGEDRDALLPLQVHRVHHPVGRSRRARGTRRPAGAWRRPGWSCRGRRGRRWRRCGGRGGSACAPSFPRWVNSCGRGGQWCLATQTTVIIWLCAVPIRLGLPSLLILLHGAAPALAFPASGSVDSQTVSTSDPERARTSRSSARSPTMRPSRWSARCGVRTSREPSAARPTGTA